MAAKPKIILFVYSDLVSDQRVHKIANTLYKNDYNVLVIGRKQKNSLPLPNRGYATKRVNSRFKKNILAYAEFMFRIFFVAINKKANLYIVNDAEPLLPILILSKIKQVKFIHDAHEFFTGIEGMDKKPLKKKIWLLIEKLCIPKSFDRYTVNNSVANAYNKLMNINYHLIYNVPSKIVETENRKPENSKKILLIQGSGLNANRGVEEAILAMKYLPNNFHLQIIGTGDLWYDFKRIVKENSLEQSVEFIDKLPFEELVKFTKKAWLGLSLDKKTSLNHQFMLPNKIFDYINANIPFLSSSLPEVVEINQKTNTGWIIEDIEPKKIAEEIKTIEANLLLYNQKIENCKIAMQNYNWENQEKTLLNIVAKALK